MLHAAIPHAGPKKTPGVFLVAGCISIVNVYVCVVRVREFGKTAIIVDYKPNRNKL
jgi:hypothetical protein